MEHQRGEKFWNAPGAVAVEYAGGRVETVTFATRIEAEQWLGLLPGRQAAGEPDVAGIVAAQMVGTPVVLRAEDIGSAMSWN